MLFQSLRGNTITKFLRLLKFITLQSGIKGKKDTPMIQAFKQRWPFQIIRDKYVKYYNIKEKYLARGNFDIGYNNLDTFTLKRRLVPFVSTRTSECTLMANSYGIDYCWPLLDVRLIQFFYPYHQNTNITMVLAAISIKKQ